MNILKKKLEAHGDINVSIVGAGLMGRSLVAQLKNLENFKVAVLSSKDINSVLEAYRTAGYNMDKVVVCNSEQEIDGILRRGDYVATTNNSLVYLNSFTHAVVDCTGNVNCGAEVAYNSLLNKKHVITLNVEADVVVGHILKELAAENEVVYTGTAGDEPGAIMEIYNFAKFIGFDILAAGKGKNNKLDHFATPDSLEEEARKKGVSSRMLTSFVDGTNTMIELNSVCNSTGLLPDTLGCHGIDSNIEELADKMSLKTEGGLLDNYGVVEFVRGVAPGVFVVVRSDSPIVDSEMKYLNMGEGPNYVIFRPYHLTSLETPISIAKSVLELTPSIVPEFKKPIAETITVAKRDITAGEYLEGIGSKTVYGLLEEYNKAKNDNLLPIGLITENAKVKMDIKKGEMIKYNQVQLDESTFIFRLKKLQLKTIEEIA